MAIEIVDFPMKNGGSFHSFLYVYQRVSTINVLGPVLTTLMARTPIYCLSVYQYWAPRKFIHFSRIVYTLYKLINHPATGYPIYGKPTIFPYFQCSILFLQDFRSIHRAFRGAFSVRRTDPKGQTIASPKAWEHLRAQLAALSTFS